MKKVLRLRPRKIRVREGGAGSGNFAMRLCEALKDETTRLIKRARFDYIVGLEILVARCQDALWQRTLAAEPHIVSAVQAHRRGDVLTTVVSSLFRTADDFLRKAADLGFERALQDLQAYGWITSYEQPVSAPLRLSYNARRDNENYLHHSLLPDLRVAFNGVYHADDVSQALQKFRARIESYGHYVWRTAEMAYREGLREFFNFRIGKFSDRFKEGGPGSGHWGHAGRKGMQGGSMPGPKGDLTHKRFIYLIGGSRSGKSAITKELAIRFGITHIINSDEIKKNLPMYSRKEGELPGSTKDHPLYAKDKTMYGPSGPRTWDELAKYPPSEIKAMQDYLAGNTKFDNLQQFSDYLKAQAGGKDIPAFDGGLTHEISSYIAKTDVRTTLENANEADSHSFIYDTVGSPKGAMAADKLASYALSQGLRPEIIYVNTPDEVRHMRNDRTDRGVATWVVNDSGVKAASTASLMRNWVSDNVDRGLGPRFRTVRGSNAKELRAARDAGWTPTGRA